MIKFTVITCTYRAESVLQRTLNSVLEQTHVQVEHLIIDGASTDGTLQMAQQYAVDSVEQAPGHDVSVVSEPDKGLYDAMNKGLQMATGDYVVFMNAGDVFPSADTLERVSGSVGESELLPGVLYGDTDIVDAGGRFVRHRRLAPPNRLTWWSFLQGMVVCHQAFYARTDLAKLHPYRLKYRYSADVDWCIRVMKAAQQRRLPLRRVPAVVVHYLDGGMTEQHHRASLKERFHVMTSHYGWFLTVCMHLWFAVRSVFMK